MAKLVRVFISATHRRLIGIAVWALAFMLVLIALGGYALHRVDDTIRLEARVVTDHFERLGANLRGTLRAMHAELTAEPCTPAFNEQLRKIAYRPDGINEFLYAPGGQPTCSVGIEDFRGSVTLGRPDVGPVGELNTQLWIRRDLGFIGLEGESGTIALSEPYAAIVPQQNVEVSTPGWLSMEVVTVAADGSWWNRTGPEGIYAAASAASGRWSALTGQMHRLRCDEHGVQCVAATADLVKLLAAEKPSVGGALLLAALLASLALGQVNALIARHWSFEARFRRHLDAASMVCAYQPLMALESGEITGCEVLARWRDVDGSIVFPDRFIDIVERHGMTLRFTEMVARRAFAELSEHLPAGRRLQVNFNIFPCDLDSARLARAFSCFLARPDRFDLVLEIIESDEIPQNAQREIEALRAMGVRTYIDDFGSGYSSMENLAALPVDGVKLDRAFAMAPDDSLMAQMLHHAIDMMHATGRVMVVEGVETATRLAMLRQMRARVDFAQGYFISRPLDIADFADFMSHEPAPAAGQEAWAAA